MRHDECLEVALSQSLYQAKKLDDIAFACSMMTFSA